MTHVDKFRSDAMRIVARAKSDAAHYDAQRTCDELVLLFENSCHSLGELPHAFATHWLTHALDDAQSAPSESAVDKLCALFSLLTDYEIAAEDEALFSSDEWRAFSLFVNDEADNLPLDVLSSLMAFFVEKKALS